VTTLTLCSTQEATHFLVMARLYSAASDNAVIWPSWSLLLLRVVPISIDQQVDAGIRVLPDQVDGLGRRTDKAAQRAASSQPLALRRHCGVVACEKPSLDTGLFDGVVIATLCVAMSAQHRQLIPYLRNVAADDIAGIGQTAWLVADASAAVGRRGTCWGSSQARQSAPDTTLDAAKEITRYVETGRLKADAMDAFDRATGYSRPPVPRGREFLENTQYPRSTVHKTIWR
jgi:hypothetical protein